MPGLPPDGNNSLSKNTTLVLLHPQDLFFVALDESPTYRIEDIAEVELPAVDTDDVESSFYFRVQNHGNPVLVGIVVVELRISDHHVPLGSGGRFFDPFLIKGLKYPVRNKSH